MSIKKTFKKITGFIFLIFLSLFGFISSAKPINAALCPSGGAQTISSSCEINGGASYTDLTITGGAVITSLIGQTINITATGKVQIDSGSGIDVTGKGNNTAGQGSPGTSNALNKTTCEGVHASGGGGGGYGGKGAKGENDVSQIGGLGGAVNGSNTNPSALGSLGGLGGLNTAGAGLGGGAVKIKAPTIIMHGFIKANGLPGSDPIGQDGTGAGGGGSGGSIWLQASASFDFSGGSLEANGGNGGLDVNCRGSDGKGGAGGGGRISVQYKGPKIGNGSHSETGGTSYGIGDAGTFHEDACFFTDCSGYCGGADMLTAYNAGTCDAVTGKCVFGYTKDCKDGVGCTFDSCDAGVCGNVQACGGLVPCGRLVDNPTTGDINESFPCNVCTMLYLLKNIINYVMTLAIGIAVFVIVLAGLLYALSTGDQKRISEAKAAITSTLIGLAIIFIAWLVIAVILQSLGYANIATWNQVDCL